MLIADPEGHDVTRGLVDLAVDNAEALWSLGGYIELHPSKPGEITTDVSAAEQLSPHASDVMARIDYDSDSPSLAGK